MHFLSGIRSEHLYSTDWLQQERRKETTHTLGRDNT